AQDQVDNSRIVPISPVTIATATGSPGIVTATSELLDVTDRLFGELRRNEVIAFASSIRFRAPVPYMIDIGFESLLDKRARNAFLGVGTNFHLPPEQVKALISTGCTLLKSNPVFRCMLTDLERDASGHHQTKSACEEVSKSFNPSAAARIDCPKQGSWPQ